METLSYNSQMYKDQVISIIDSMAWKQVRDILVAISEGEQPQLFNFHNDYNMKKEPPVDKVEAFVERLKLVMYEASRLNGQERVDRSRGNDSAPYKINVNYELFCHFIENLANVNRPAFEKYLQLKSDVTASGCVCPYLGVLFDAKVFQNSRMKKLDFYEIFEKVYARDFDERNNCDTAKSCVKQMSNINNFGKTAEDLLEITSEELKKIRKVG